MINFLKRFGPLLVLAALVVLAFASGVTNHLSLDELRANRETLNAFVIANRWLALAVFMAVYVAVAALSLPGALFLTLAGGLLFGPWLGGAASLVSATLGASIVFLVCRTAFGGVLAKRAGSGLARLEEGIARDAFSYLLVLRLVPAAPFFVVNIAAGLVRIPLTTFILASLIGMAPGSLVYSSLGAGLNHAFAAGQEPNLSIIFQPQILLPLIGLALLSLLPIIVRRVRGKKATTA
ncbi:MAG: TVP38/TMEM64 family protein [Caulobacter sp.]|nr:TVP38/TMEM64 family protein [Caulobacter sp.]